MPSALMTEIRETPVREGQVALWWLGQAAFVYKFANEAVVAVDPFLSATSPRLMPPPVDPPDFDVDLILCTHDHVDHFDYPIFRYLMRGRPDLQVGGPASVFAHYNALSLPLDQFTIMNRGDEREFCDLNVRAVFAEHDSGRARDAVGFVIDGGGVRVYQTGDTLFNEHVTLDARDLAPDILAVPINGRLGNMAAEEAAELTAIVQPNAVIPMHYGMFAHNTIDPRVFLDAAQEKGVESEILLCQPAVKCMYTRPV